MCRLAPSFLRFGSFQLPASRGGLDRDLVRVLADYAIRHHFPELEDLPTPERGGKNEGEGEGEGEEQDPDSVVPADNKYTGECECECECAHGLLVWIAYVCVPMRWSP